MVESLKVLKATYVAAWFGVEKDARGFIRIHDKGWSMPRQVTGFL